LELEVPALQVLELVMAALALLEVSMWAPLARILVAQQALRVLELSALVPV